MASLGQPPRRFTIRVAATSPATCACASSKIHPTSVSSDFSEDRGDHPEQCALPSSVQKSAGRLSTIRVLLAARLPAPVFRCFHQRLLGCGSAAETVRERLNGAALLLVPDQSD
jgi:hypothetical protein